MIEYPSNMKPEAPWHHGDGANGAEFFTIKQMMDSILKGMAGKSLVVIPPQICYT
jgi:hypothetical protein